MRINDDVDDGLHANYSFLRREAGLNKLGFQVSSGSIYFDVHLLVIIII